MNVVNLVNSLPVVTVISINIPIGKRRNNPRETPVILLSE